MAPHLQSIFGRFDFARFWARQKAVLFALDVAPMDGVKLAVVFYDEDLNLVERESAVYELSIYSAHALEWKLLRGTPEDIARFTIYGYLSEWDVAEWAQFPANVISDLIPKLVHTPGSHCQMAFRWIHLDWHSRFRIFLSTHRGSLDDCEKILTWLAWIFSPNDRALPSGSWTIAVKQEESDYVNPSLWAHVKRDCVMRWGNNPLQLSDKQLKLLRAVQRYFLPFYFENARRYHPCVRQIWKNGEFSWQFDFPSPSQHERLEARMQLRHWLQNKVASEEIPILLGDS